MLFGLLQTMTFVGGDAFKLMEIRKSKSDKESRKLVMDGVLK
jgi:hypothetical protein